MPPLTSNWASVMTGGCVYVGIVKREEFDRIDLLATDHGTANHDRPLLTKTMHNPSCMVVFQHWYGPTPIERAAEAAVAKALTRMADTREVS